MRHKLGTWLALGGLCFSMTLFACGTEPGTPDAGHADAGADAGQGVAMTWPEVNETLIRSCAFSQCHAIGNPAGMFALGATDDYPVLVGAASTELPSLDLIEPGAPQASYLYRKLEGSQALACEEAGRNVMLCGEPMPRGRPPLPEGTLEGLRLWIAAGALR